jgi:hypothetical protein
MRNSGIPEELVGLPPLPYNVEALFEMVEQLAPCLQVGAILTESPLDGPGGEQAMWLVQSHVRLRVDPHAADACPAVDQDDLLIAR